MTTRHLNHKMPFLNNKRITLIMGGLIFSATTYSQSLNKLAGKPSIDSSAYNNWPSIEGAAISNDGKYVLYTIMNYPEKSNTLIIQSTYSGWKVALPDATQAIFTQDNSFVIFKKLKDTLGIISLGKSSIKYIPNVSSFRLIKHATINLLAYKLSDLKKTLVVRNLANQMEKRFTGTIDYLFDRDGNSVILHIETLSNGGLIHALNLITLENDGSIPIWKGQGLGKVIFDKSGRQLAFTVCDTINHDVVKSFWYYEMGMSSATLLSGDQSPGIDKDLQLNDINRFSEDGNTLFISLKERKSSKLNPDAVKLNVWSYTDVTLQSYQLKNQIQQDYVAVINTKSHLIVRLEQKYEMLEFVSGINAVNDSMALLSIVRKGGGEADVTESNWNIFNQLPVSLVNTRTGERTFLDLESIDQTTNRSISPKGKYLIYYNVKRKSFFCYEIASGINRNITRHIITNWTPSGELTPGSTSASYPPAMWLADDKAVLLYDKYDIWQADPLGIETPVNLTKGFGRKNNIELRLIFDNRTPIQFDKQNLLLVAYNHQTKDNGFFKLNLNKLTNPELLTMGPFIYSVPNVRIDIHGSPILKATDVNVFVVQRMSASESPNYFLTNDFKKFSPLSNIYPEQRYNWVKSELHQFRTSDGNILKGVLFKPENFDSTKKYPVIFYYYETVSDLLNAYVKPSALNNGCAINIPSFISNGYLVFCPDIHYKFGELGQGALDAVESAAKYLLTKSFVNPKRLGLQGCSLGGIETNYIVTHSKLFSAACTSSGISDFISGYGSLDGQTGSSNQNMFETGQFRIGTSIWSRPELYIKNSPILYANKVSTPLLIMHTTNDIRCPFINTVEFFTALRRLGKKAWMLEYEEGNHGLKGKNSIDFSIRMSQFFNHYLKDSACPRWMLYGIEAKDKGVIDGLDLVREKDPKTDKWLTPKEGGLLTDEEKKKVEALKRRNLITITLQ